ncbi:glycoside hydrolase superfamily [Xylariales sp. PMI_506]|nr:glycoside hydrolase superfamily [Xylariales sp. PMI_506]
MQHFAKSLVAAALAAAPALASSVNVNAYWGQNGGTSDSLAEYCASSSIDSVTVSFVNWSPEHNSGWPGMNLAGHCSSYYNDKNGNPSKTIDCTALREDIYTCQKIYRKKVYVSIGGAVPSDSNYNVSTVAKGERFAFKLWNMFGPKNESSTLPRPFDVSSTNTTCVDGFDFDLEYYFPDNAPYIALINKLRALIDASSDRDVILSASPQCPLSDEYFQMHDVLGNCTFDKVFVQFYNNPGCNAVEVDSSATSWTAWNNWESQLLEHNNTNAKLYLGLMADPTSGVAPSDLQSLIDLVKSRPMFGGVSIWDAYLAKTEYNTPYYDSVKNCGSSASQSSTASTISASTVSSSTASASTVSSSTASDSTVSSSTASDSTVSSSVVSSSTASASVTGSITITATPSTITSSATVSETDICEDESSTTVSSATETETDICEEETPSATPTGTAPTGSIPTGSGPSGSGPTGSIPTGSGPSGSAPSGSAPSGSGPSGSAPSGSGPSGSGPSGSAPSGNAPSGSGPSGSAPSGSGPSGSAPSGSGPTGSIPTGSGPSGSAPSGSAPSGSGPSGSAPSGSAPSGSGPSGSAPSGSAPSGSPSGPSFPSNSTATGSSGSASTSDVELVTSTVRTTVVHTVTSCASYITDCPASGSVVTEVIDVYTTVCPVTATMEPTGYTLSTSTLYSTVVHTITSCAADVVNCPARTSTESVPVSTTLVAVKTETTPAGGAAATTAPAAGAGASGSNYPAASGSPAVVKVGSSVPAGEPTSTNYVDVTVYPTASAGKYGNGTVASAGPSAGSSYVASHGTTLTSAVQSTTTTTTAATTTATGGSIKAASLSLAGVVLAAVLAL